MKKTKQLMKVLFTFSAVIYSCNVFAVSATSKNYIYLTKNTTTDTPSLYRCTINLTNAYLESCTSLDTATTGQDTSGNASYLYAHSVTVVGNVLYVNSVNKSNISWLQACPLDSSGNIGTCTSAFNLSGDNDLKKSGHSTVPIATSIMGATINKVNYLYVGDAYSRIYMLNVDSTTNKLTYNVSSGMVFDGNDVQGNVVLDMVFNSNTLELFFVRGTDSSDKSYLQSVTLNSANGLNIGNNSYHPYVKTTAVLHGLVYADGDSIVYYSLNGKVNLLDGSMATSLSVVGQGIISLVNPYNGINYEYMASSNGEVQACLFSNNYCGNGTASNNGVTGTYDIALYTVN